MALFDFENFSGVIFGMREPDFAAPWFEFYDGFFHGVDVIARRSLFRTDEAISKNLVVVRKDCFVVQPRAGLLAMTVIKVQDAVF